MDRPGDNDSVRNRDRDLNLIDRIVKDVQSWIRHDGEQSSRARNEPATMKAASHEATYAEQYYGDEAGFSGKGPHGYVRPDARVYEDVCERLTAHATIDASAIKVSVTDGIVELSGEADNRASKRLAESLVESVSGVRDVDNCLKLGGSQITSDDTL